MQQLVIRTTNKLSMMNPYLILFSIFAILCQSLAKAQEAEAAAAMHLAYDGRTTDKELLEAFVLVLEAPTKCRSADAAQLLRLAGSTAYSPDASVAKQRRMNRQHAVQALFVDYKITPNGPDFGQINRTLLYISAALLGLEVDQTKLLALAADSQRPREIRLVAVEAVIAQETVIPEAKPVLIALAGNNWSYIKWPGVGPRTPERIFPFREVAAKGLSRLGVPFRKIKVPDSAGDPNGSAILFETRIELEGPKK